MDFTICDFRIHLDFTFFAMLGIFLYLDVSAHTWWMLSALLLHELGHFLAAMLCGIRMKSISFSCFGIRLTRESIMCENRMHELLVYLGGPLMNGICFLLFWLLEMPFPCAVHVLLGIFQLLPIGALDGGCVMRLFLEWYLSPEKSEKIGIWISCGVLLPLFLLGLCLLWRDGHNFTLLLCCVFLLFSVFGEENEKI